MTHISYSHQAVLQRFNQHHITKIQHPAALVASCVWQHLQPRSPIYQLFIDNKLFNHILLHNHNSTPNPQLPPLSNPPTPQYCPCDHLVAPLCTTRPGEATPGTQGPRAPGLLYPEPNSRPILFSCLPPSSPLTKPNSGTSWSYYHHRLLLQKRFLQRCWISKSLHQVIDSSLCIKFRIKSLLEELSKNHSTCCFTSVCVCARVHAC